MAGRRNARTNALVTCAAVIGIIVLVNVIGLWVFGRLDLTRNSRYSLSDVSINAVRALEGLEVSVFVSPDLPTEIVYQGRQLQIEGFDRDLMDKISEYKSYAAGRMKVTVVKDDLEGRAAKARLELFTGKEAIVEHGKLEFRKYVLGAVFQYRNQIEVLPVVTDPASLEFEITRILTRLQQKYEKSSSIEDILSASRRIHEAAAACSDKLTSYKGDRGQPGGLGILNAGTGGGVGVGTGTGGGLKSALAADLKTFGATCNSVGVAVSAAAGFADRNALLGGLIQSARLYQDAIDRLVTAMSSGSVEDADLAGLVQRMETVYGMVDGDYQTLVNSPGRRGIAFMCGHREFCPFPDDAPLVDPQIARILAGKNQDAAIFLTGTTQIQDQINTINNSLRLGLYENRGLDVRSVGPGEDIPDDVEALVVFGAESPLSETDRYKIDQFLLSGRSVIVFVNAWDVALWNLDENGDFASSIPMNDTHLQARSSNISNLLEKYGVKVNGDLVVGLKSFADVSVIQMSQEQGSMLQGRKDYPYPLLPVFDAFDSTHVLVRNLPGVVLPWATTLSVSQEVRKSDKVKVTDLIKTSSNTAAVGGLADVLPTSLFARLSSLRAGDSKPVAVVLNGEFQSAFAGPLPDDGSGSTGNGRAFRANGTGRLLVVGSSMGFENLSGSKVFAGFSLTKMTEGKALLEADLVRYAARFQNWQIRLSQVSSTVRDNIEFVFNCLDWGVQNDALVDIRSKSQDKRTVATLSSGAATAVELVFIVGLPLLFGAFGLIRHTRRQRRV